MAKIINLQVLKKRVREIKKQGRSIVLVGGCFDILHIGHIKFFKAAKKSGDLLFILLESDETVKKLKGNNRPYFCQKDRAEVLASLSYTDYIVLMKHTGGNEYYDRVVQQISPNIIAVTANDPLLTRKKNQAKRVKGDIKIIPYVETFSSSRVAKLLEIE